MDNIANFSLNVASIFVSIYLVAFIIAKVTSIIIIIRSYIGTEYTAVGKEEFKTVGVFMAIKLYFYYAFIEKVKR